MKVRFRRPKIEKSELFSFSTLGALLFAVSLWIYTSLNDEYSTRVDVPLRIELPENRSPESNLPSSVTILAKGTGWNLFNLMYLNQNKICDIDLRNELINEEEYLVQRQTIEKSLRNMVTIESEGVFPEIIPITTGPTIEKRVPVRSNLEIIPDENFITATQIRFSPDTVIVKGSPKVLRNLNYWPTESQLFEGINKPVIAEVPLKDTLSTIVEVSEKTTEAKIEIQQEAEFTLTDLKLKIIGPALNTSESLSASKVDITIRGGVEELTRIQIDEIKAYINLEELSKDNILIPKVSLPEDYRLVNVSPRYIYKYTTKKNIGQLR
jgi:YbbR domain-containing protein